MNITELTKVRNKNYIFHLWRESDGWRGSLMKDGKYYFTDIAEKRSYYVEATLLKQTGGK
jgi:hypothetical protein